MALTIDFLENLALLALVGLGVFLVGRIKSRYAKIYTQVLYGLVFGAAAFLVTATPLTLADGATLDTRAGPVLLAGVIGGPAGALIAATLGALSRGLVGGSFAFSGVAVYFVYTFIGLALAQVRLVQPTTVSRPASIAVLSAGSFAGAALMFFLIQPTERAILWLQNDLPFIFGANLLSVAYTACVVGVAMTFVRKTEEVQELNERLALAKRAGGFGTWDYNLETRRLEWDDVSAEMHGLHATEKDRALEHWLKHIHPDDLAPIEAAFQSTLTEGAPLSVEYRVQLPGDVERTIKGDAIVVSNADGSPMRVVGANLDLTELRTTKASLVEAQSIAMEAQKFDSIGKMTGGVAHDFNNLLAVIMGNQELLRDAILDDGASKEELDDLVEASIQATKRGAELTRNLLAYARRAQLKPETVDLNKAVHQTETWLRRTIESRVEIECVLQAGVWPVLADRASLQSALINLLINARDALDGPGRVTIETANIRIDKDYLDPRGEVIAPGRYVMLAVSDTGPGIPAEELGKIFDPFYTTKPVGKGSGLGLSMVQGFVTQSGGTIRVYSEVGAGTSFKLYFPASDVASHVIADAPSNAVQKANGERILLVDDQEELLTVMQRALKGAGYTVVTAKSGDVAFETFKADRKFDLIATDIVMPGTLQGPALSKAIRAIDPAMRFIFFSGYAPEATLFGNGLRTDDISLMKPIARNDLLEAVKSTLDRHKENV